MKKMYTAPVIEEWGKVVEVTKTLGISGPGGKGSKPKGPGGKSKPKGPGGKGSQPKGKGSQPKDSKVSLQGGGGFGLV